MLEDKILLWKLKRGSEDALRLLYEKYKNDLLALAIALSNDKNTAEDAVHDTFVAFVQITEKLQLRTNLKGYLLTSVANRVRTLKQAARQETALDEIESAETKSDSPVGLAIAAEQASAPPPVVVVWMNGLGSIMHCQISSVEQKVLMGITPPPRDFAVARMSGTTPQCSKPHIFPVRPIPV